MQVIRHFSSSHLEDSGYIYYDTPRQKLMIDGIAIDISNQLQTLLNKAEDDILRLNIFEIQHLGQTYRLFIEYLYLQNDSYQSLTGMIAY